MTGFLIGVGVVLGIWILVLAAIGFVTLRRFLSEIGHDSRTSQAEQQISEISRAAQMAILQEALRRATRPREKWVDGEEGEPHR
jgi:hypothetical protein